MTSDVERCAHRLVGQPHARRLEIVRLAQRRAQELLAAVRIEQARRDADADLVGVAEPVGADVAVVAEQLHHVEVRDVPCRTPAWSSWLRYGT